MGYIYCKRGICLHCKGGGTQVIIMNTVPSYPMQSLRKEELPTEAVSLKVDLAGTASRLQRLVKEIDSVRNDRCEEDLETVKKKEIELAGAKRILADRESLINRLDED